MKRSPLAFWYPVILRRDPVFPLTVCWAPMDDDSWEYVEKRNYLFVCDSIRLPSADAYLDLTIMAWDVEVPIVLRKE